MNIAGVVNQESHGSGHTVSFGMLLVGTVHDCLVLVGILVVISLVEPFVEGGEDLGDVVGIEGEVEVANFSTLVEEWLINKVPSSLVLATMVFLNDISKSCALREHMIAFILGPLCIDVSQWLEDLDGSSVS